MMGGWHAQILESGFLRLKSWAVNIPGPLISSGREKASRAGLPIFPCDLVTTSPCNASVLAGNERLHS